MGMITIIGTGHVFNISEQIMFLIKQIWPQAVLVELDGSRLNALEASGNEQNEKSEEAELPWIYRSTAKYQARMSKKYGTRTGNELLTAVQTGRLIEAEIGMIDVDVVKLTNEMWAEMSFFERARYTISTRISQLVGLLCFVGGTAAMIAIHFYRKKHPEFAAYQKPVPATADKTDEPTEPPTEETSATDDPEKENRNHEN